jgi:hypothetical protein
MLRVRKADLGPLEELSEGGYGKVYRAPHYRLPGDPVTAIAYKEFTVDVTAQATSAEKAVSFRDPWLGPADRADLDRCTVWPRAVVEEQGAVVGLIMPLIPDEFFIVTTDPDGGSSRKLRDLQWLIATPAVLRLNGVPDFDQTERLALLAQLVYDVGRLHKHGWVYGDISLKNAAFAVSPPRMILLDCDGAADATDVRRRQGHSLGWEPPECAQLHYQDQVTDVYKLGLAILRCLNREKGAATTRDPGRVAGKLDPAGAALVGRAVGRDRAGRPTAKELYAYLSSEVRRRVRPPEVITARLATPLRARGMDVRIEWEIKNVTEVTVRVGAGAPQAVPDSGRPQVHIVRSPQQSGPVTIEAANRFGAVRVDLGELILYEAPRFDPTSLIGALPRLPRLPALPDYDLRALAPIKESLPKVSMPGFPAIPSIRTAELSDVIREMALPGADVAEVIRFPDFGALIAGPTREVAAILTDQARRMAESRPDSILESSLASAKDDD